MKVSYHSKIVGVTFEGRQDVIKVLKGDEPLSVRREADNAYDQNAVAVDVQFGEDFLPIGYIAKDKNLEIAKALDAGNEILIKIASITGGGPGGPDGNEKSYGVNIQLEYETVEEVAKEPLQLTKSSVLENFAELVNLITKDGYEVNISSTKKNTKEITSFLTGQTIEATVTNGHVGLPGYTSGSQFPEQFYAPFDEDGILKGIVEKFGVSAEQVKAMWELNKDASTGYGSAIHAALENYDRNFELGDKTKKVEVLKTKTKIGPNKALSRNPFLKKIVEDFHEKFGGDYERFSEQFVWLTSKMLCGSIDRIKVIDLKKKIIRIQDFKTDGDIHEKKYQLTTSPFYALTQGSKPKLGKELLDFHWFQLSFYAYILKQYGWTVEGLDVYWLNPEKLIKGENAWEEFSHDVIDIEGVL